MSRHAAAPFVSIYTRCPICDAPTMDDDFRNAVICPEHGAVPHELAEDGFTGVAALIQLRAWEAMQEIHIMARAALAKINKGLDDFRQMERVRRIAWFFAHDREAGIREVIGQDFLTLGDVIGPRRVSGWTAPPAQKYRFHTCGWKSNADGRLEWFDEYTETP